MLLKSIFGKELTYLILLLIVTVESLKLEAVYKKKRKPTCKEDIDRFDKNYNSQLKILDGKIQLNVGDIVHCEVIVEDIGDIDKPWISTEVKVVNTPNSQQYQYFPATLGENCFTFKVQASNDAWISLSNMPAMTNPMIEFVLECCNTTKIVILQTNDDGLRDRTDGGEDLPELLDENEFQAYWISWYDGVFKAGRQGEEKALITLKPPNFDLAINFIGIRTTDGASGVWILEEPKCPSKPQKPVSEIPPSLGTKCWTPDVTVNGEIFSSEEV